MIASCLNYKNKIINVIKTIYNIESLQYRKLYSELTWCSHFHNAPPGAH